MRLAGPTISHSVKIAKAFYQTLYMSREQLNNLELKNLKSKLIDKKYSGLRKVDMADFIFYNHFVSHDSSSQQLKPFAKELGV